MAGAVCSYHHNDVTQRIKITVINELLRNSYVSIFAAMKAQSTVFALASPSTLQRDERLFYRDTLRSARYSALADAEGFANICFALEDIGLRLLGKKRDLGSYEESLGQLASDSVVLSQLSLQFPKHFTNFQVLYSAVRRARNDAMHTGVYARHVTSAAIELCIGLEEAIMKQQDAPKKLVADFMVKLPISVEVWQPVAHARQLMLTHSFSFLPILRNGWKLLSEVAMAKYLNSGQNFNELLAAPIESAIGNGLTLVDAKVVAWDSDVSELLDLLDEHAGPTLWLVEDRQDKLAGVLSPFELM